MVSMKHLILGQRVPRGFFITTGSGESDLTTHAGSFHLALRAAGIEMFNIMTYSSIIPAGAALVKEPKEKVHGAVLECIMARIDVRKNHPGVAGIGFGFLRDKSGKSMGGIVVERTVEGLTTDVEIQCRNSLMELYENGYSKYELTGKRIITSAIVPNKEYGTALVSLCFVDYVVPVIGEIIRH
jgi:arginine decarboxylase